MTFEQLGGLGQFVGALAVLGSLLYVAREIRQNTRASRLATHQAAVDLAQRSYDPLVRDAELARIVRVGLADLANLTEDEGSRLHWWITINLRAIENFFVQNRDGALDDQTWEARARAAVALLSTPAGRDAWERMGFSYRDDFRAWVTAALEGGPDPDVMSRLQW